jgi:hypothetical protein
MVKWSFAGEGVCLRESLGVAMQGIGAGAARFRAIDEASLLRKGVRMHWQGW